MKSKKLEVIKCPVCGKEYLPCEIYLPNSFFGRPKAIYKDGFGRVEGILGSDMDLRETFTCEDCNTPFSVNCKLQFNVVPLSKLSTTSEYKTPLLRKCVLLDED